MSNKKVKKACDFCDEACQKPWCVVKTEEAEEKEKENDGDTGRDS